MRVGPTLDKILADYRDSVRVVYKMHPLPMHQNAMIAAEAAMAAQAQGKFAEMHAKLISGAPLTRENILKMAAETGLDMARFTNDLDTHAHKGAIEAETKEAMSIGATGTPSSFVNGRYVFGAATYESFKKLIDEELAKGAGAKEAKKDGGMSAAP